MATTVNIPAPPPGFVIGDLPVEEEAAREQTPVATEGVPAPPAGFVIDQQQPEEQETGLISNVTNRFLERFGDPKEELFALGTGDVTLPETLLRGTAAGTGAITGVLGEAVSEITPDVVKEFASDVGKAVLNTSVGQKGLEALQQGIENFQEFKKNNPRVGRNIEDLASFALNSFSLGNAPQFAKQIASVPKSVYRAGKTAFGGTKPLASKDLATLANNAYSNADRLGGSLTPGFTDKFLDKIKKFRPQTPEGKAVVGEDAFSKVIQRMDELKGRPISLQGAQEIDEFLTDRIDELLDVGRRTKQSKKVLNIQNVLRESIEKASPGDVIGGREGFAALKEGRKLWSASRKVDDIERILQKADLIDNPATAIKTGFRNLVSSPARARGFTKKELELMRKAAKTGVFSDFLRVTLGSRLIPIITLGSGGGIAQSGAAAIGSQIGRSAADIGARRRGQRVITEIGRRATER